MFSTTLGSCIAVCMRDPVTRCGGINHFVLPHNTSQPQGYPDARLRYGSYSIERLINALLANGASRTRLEIKVFGGADLLQFGARIGSQNADFVESYLNHEGFTVSASCLRGNKARRLVFAPATGAAWVKGLKSVRTSVIECERQAIGNTVKPGNIELFAEET